MDKIVELLNEINFYSFILYLCVWYVTQMCTLHHSPLHTNMCTLHHSSLHTNMCTLHHNPFIFTLIFLAVGECSHFSNNWPMVTSS